MSKVKPEVSGVLGTLKKQAVFLERVLLDMTAKAQFGSDVSVRENTFFLFLFSLSNTDIRHDN